MAQSLLLPIRSVQLFLLSSFFSLRCILQNFCAAAVQAHAVLQQIHSITASQHHSAAQQILPHFPTFAGRRGVGRCENPSEKQRSAVKTHSKTSAQQNSDLRWVAWGQGAVKPFSAVKGQPRPAQRCKNNHPAVPPTSAAVEPTQRPL